MSQSFKNKRVREFKSQNGRCYYLQIPMWLPNVTEHLFRSGITTKAMSRIHCTVEHMTARSDGGSDASENLVAACRFCNQTRHRQARSFNSKDFWERVMSRVRAGKWHPDYFHTLYRS